MNNKRLNNKAEQILDKITVGLHHPQFREAIISCMKEFAEWQIAQFKTEQKQSADIKELPEIMALDSKINTCVQLYGLDYLKQIQRLFWFAVDAINNVTLQKQLSNEDELEANPHICPICSWQCTCDSQPCSCCNETKAEQKQSADVIEEIACEFYDWNEKYGWLSDHNEQETKDTKRKFKYFIENIYKPTPQKQLFNQ